MKKVLFLLLALLTFSVANAYRTLPDGIYRIACGNNPALCMDIPGASTGEVRVQIYDANTSDAQRFRLRYDAAHGGYAIQALCCPDNFYLGHDYPGGNNYTYLIQSAYNSANDNEYYWQFDKQSEGIYKIKTIINNYTYKWLSRGSTARGSSIYLYTVDAPENTWKLIREDDAKLAEGVYRIASADGNSIGLGLAMTSINGRDGTMALKTHTNDDYKKWYVKPIGDGQYSITLKDHPTWHLNLDASKKTIHVWDFKQEGVNETSKWWIAQVDGGYNIVCANLNGVAGDGYVDVKNAAFNDGQTLQGWECNGNVAQKWKIVKLDDQKTIDDGIYRIVYKYNNDQNYGFNISGNRTDAGAPLWLWENAGAQQTWEVVHIGDGLYTIKYADSGLPLGAVDGKVANGTTIEQNTRVDKAANQEWFIRKNGSNGYYTIVNHRALRSIDLDDGRVGNEGHLHLWDPSNGGSNQTWAFEPVFEDVNIGAAQYATLYYGKCNLKVPDGVEALTFDLNQAKNRIQADLTYNAGDVIPKTEPVVVHYKPNNLTQPTTFKFQRMLDSAVGKAKSENNQLKGTDTETEIGVDPKMTDDQFLYTLVRLTETTVGFNIMPAKNGYAKGKYLNNGAHRAYLLVDRSKLGGNMPASISFDLEDDEETDIQALPEATNHKLQATDEIYNLSGQCLQKMQRGVNIVGGKKVVIM